MVEKELSGIIVAVKLSAEKECKLISWSIIVQTILSPLSVDVSFSCGHKLLLPISTKGELYLNNCNQIEDDLQITNLHCNKLSMLHALGVWLFSINQRTEK